MRSRWFPLLIIILLAAAVLPKVLLVPKVEKGLEQELIKAFAAESAAIKLVAPLGWEILFGRIPRFSLQLQNVQEGEITLTEVNFFGEQVRFVPSAFFRHREFVYLGAAKLEGLITLAEKDLNDYFWRKVDPAKNFRLLVHANEIRLEGKLSLWSQEFDVRLNGTLAIWENSWLRFNPGEFAVGQTRVPPILLELLNDNYDFVVELPAFLEPIQITDLHLNEGEILVEIGGIE